MKAANHYGAPILAANPHESSGQRVMFVSADDDDAKNAVTSLLEDAGFYVIDVGGLRDGGRMHQYPAGPSRVETRSAFRVQLTRDGCP